MATTENAWELVCEAAFRDGVTVEIRPNVDKHIPAVDVIFTKRGFHSAVSIDMMDQFNTTRERYAQATMHGLRYALFQLLERPYREIGEEGAESGV